MTRYLFVVIIFLLQLIYLEAQQNPQEDSLDIKAYKFEIEISDTSNLIKGNASISLELKEATQNFFVELSNKSNDVGMTVSSVLINGLPSCYFHEDDKVVVKKNNGLWDSGNYELQIEYSGVPGDGLIISNNKFGRKSFFGDNWPNRAHHYLPVVDHPSEKAVFEFIITSPAELEVIASGVLIEQKTIPDGRSLYHYKTQEELAPKVAVFAATDFKVTPYDTIYGIPISSWIYEGNQKGEYDYVSSVEAFKFFSDTIGTYIYDKLANVQSRTRYGGMENAGNIFYFEQSVNGKAEVEDLIAHEVAHQWFGNAASEGNWHHIWLSEGFATYLTNLYWENKYGREAFLERIVNEGKMVLRYGMKSKRPLVDTDETDWNKMLNPNSYEKGSWVLHMLRQKTGDRAFFEILSKYYDRYKLSNALSSDFQEVAEEVSGMNLDQFFKQWLYYHENPELDFQWFYKDSTFYIKVEQLQDTEPFHLEIDLSLEGEDFVLPFKEKSKIYKLPFSHLVSEPVIDQNFKLLVNKKVTNKAFKIRNGKKPVLVDASRLDSPVYITSSQKISLIPGDLLFQDLDCGPLCDAIESVTEGFKGSNFSHVAMVTEVSGDRVFVMEAIGGKVKKTSLNNFLRRSHDEWGKPKVIVGRVKSSEIRKKALEEIYNYKGKSYDDIFNIENDSYYCSELLYYSYLEEGKPIFDLFPMTFKTPGAGTFAPAWIDYFEQLNVEIPEGEPGLNPGGISRSPYVDILYLFGEPSGYKK